MRTGSGCRSSTNSAAGSAGAGRAGAARSPPPRPRGPKAPHGRTAIAATTDGFELSRLDLEQRREGDVLGATQAGRSSSLRLLTLVYDENVILKARDEAAVLVDADPDLVGHPLLAAELA